MPDGTQYAALIGELSAGLQPARPLASPWRRAALWCGAVAWIAATFALFGDAGATPVSLAVADLDGDGKLDVATVNGSIDQSGAGSGSLTLLRGCSDGGLIAVGNLTTPLNGPRVIVALALANDAGPTSLAVAYSAAAQASFIDLFQSSCP